MLVRSSKILHSFFSSFFFRSNHDLVDEYVYSLNEYLSEVKPSLLQLGSLIPMVTEFLRMQQQLDAQPENEIRAVGQPSNCAELHIPLSRTPHPNLKLLIDALKRYARPVHKDGHGGGGGGSVRSNLNI
jgi:hypothetical protein